MTAFNNQFCKDLKVAIRKIWLVMVDWKLMFKSGARYGSVVFLLGGGPQDATGNGLLAKKLKKSDAKGGTSWVA